MFSKFFEIEEDKQARILNAAIKEFAHKGYKDASTNEIVKAAGISKGLLFHYFNSKEDLYLFLYDYTSRIFIEEFLNLINLNERDVIARWRQHALLKIDLIHKYPEMFEFITAANLPQPEEIQKGIDIRNQGIYAIGYGKLFENVDETKFRPDIDIKQALDIIRWSMEGFTSREQQRISTTGITEFDYDRMLVDLDGLFNLLRKSLYR